jgi:small subunit ribosomal protein S15
MGVFYMALTAADTAEIIKTHQRSKNDTGSSEVQISLLTARIVYLTQHMKVNPHDFHTRYGLTKLVSQRRKLMNYLKRINPTAYRDLIQKLDIRG